VLKEEALAREKGFEDCVKKGKREGESDAKIASNLVGKFILEHSYLRTGTKQETKVFSGVEATGLGDVESKLSYWDDCFKNEYTDIPTSLSSKPGHFPIFPFYLNKRLPRINASLE
jgi:hypothetical protein